MAYGNFKDLPRRTASEKILRDKAFSITKNSKYEGYQRGLASMVYNFFDKNQASLTDKSDVSDVAKCEIMSNQKLTKELHKPIIRIWKNKKYTIFYSNMLGINLAGMQMICKFSKRIRFLSCVIDIYSKHAWVVPLKYKKGIAVTNAFQQILDEPNRIPNKISLDKGSKFYNRLMKSWL